MFIKTTIFLFVVLAVQANIWDNLWSNNLANRVVFPQQFEFKMSWNATIGNRVNNTNYI